MSEDDTVDVPTEFVPDDAVVVGKDVCDEKERAAALYDRADALEDALLKHRREIDARLTTVRDLKAQARAITDELEDGEGA